MPTPSTLPGLYLATITDLADPDARGCVMLTVDSLPDEPARWAMPCVPVAGAGVALWASIRVGDKVWVTFEEDDVTHPVWVGRMWDANQLQLIGGDPSIAFWRSEYGTLIFNHTTQEVILETPEGGRLILHQQSIRHEGWPLRFSPPSDQLEQRITALENAVAALQALHGGS